MFINIKEQHPKLREGEITSRGAGNPLKATKLKNELSLCINTDLRREGPETGFLVCSYSSLFVIATYQPREGPETIYLQT